MKSKLPKLTKAQHEALVLVARKGTSWDGQSVAELVAAGLLWQRRSGMGWGVTDAGRVVLKELS